MNLRLPAFEAITVDLVAMRNWHFHCSIDKHRTPEMRRWHRRQVLEINKRIPRKGPGSLHLMKIVLIELLATKCRKELHIVAGGGGPFNWKEICREAIREIAETGHRSPSDSQRKSSECDISDKVTVNSPQDAAPSKSESSEAKA